MVRRIPVFSLVLLGGVLATAAGAEDDPRLREALAFQTARKEAIRKAEPAIACILVSRSELYRKHYDDSPPVDDPGRLGDFRPRPLPRIGGRVPDSDPFLKLDLANPLNVPESYGSGVVVDGTRGLILTNYHVVRDAAKVYVRLPGGQGSYANIHAADPRSDLAVLRLINTTFLPVPAIKMGNGGAVEKGDCVLSLANPFATGFRDGSPSVSWGMVSNIRRRAPSGQLSENDKTKTLHHYGTLLQVDARLNLGCSGGALVNLKGEMIGLTTALAAISGSETPGGFAVPLDAPMQEIVKLLMQGKEVEYGFLGVQMAGPMTEERRGEGLPIHFVTAGSPAAGAGLRTGCYILKINGKPVHDNDELFLYLGMSLAGNEAQLEYTLTARGAPQRVLVKLAKFYVPGKIIAANRPPAAHGLRVDYTSILTQRSQTGQGAPIYEGVLVREVQPGSAAYKAKLQVDKIIKRVNGRPVNSPDEFYTEMERTKNTRGPIELTLLTPEGQEERPVILNPS